VNFRYGAFGWCQRSYVKCCRIRSCV
jgi:hypothetical protein